MSTNTKDKWSFQDDIVDILIQMDREQENFSTIVDMPTGSGKTITAFKFINAMADKKGVKFLWLCDRLPLLKQTDEAYKKLVEKGDVKEVGKRQIINSSAESLIDIKSDTRILYASPRTLSNVAKAECKEFREWLKCDKLYIIYDEAHHSGAPSAVRVFSSIFGVDADVSDINCKYGVKSYGLVGLTATVYRGDKYIDIFNHWFKDGYDKEIGKLDHDTSPLGKDTEKDIACNRIAVRSIDELIEAEVIIAPKFIRKDTMRMAESKEKQIDVLVNDIAQNYKEYGKTIIFVKDIDYAEEVVKKLNDNGIDAFEFTSKKTDKEKKEVFEYEDTTEGIMVTVDKASEGFDVKNVETVYLATGIKSQILIRQRVGRVVRNSEKKNEARVVWQDYGDGYLNPETTFRLPLPKDSCSRENYESTYHFLNIMDLFSVDAIEKSESIGYFELSGGREPIYVLEKERVGYYQYYYMIQSDYIRLGGLSNFSDYAKKLELSEEELCEEIKRTCFSTNIERKSISRKQKTGLIRVNDEQLIDFFEEVISDADLIMPEYQNLSCSDNSSDEESNNTDRMCCIYKKHVKEEQKAKDFNEAVKLLSQVQREIRALNRPKHYTQNMVIVSGQQKYLNSELMSVRYLLQLGCLWNKNGDEYPSAYLGIDAEGNETRPLGKYRRYTDNVPDKMLIAYALVTRINNIKVTEEIVNNYISSISSAFGVDTSSAIYYMSALGYKDNDSIIKRQCKKCKENGNLPELLKYVIYEKAYENLYESLIYTDKQAYPLFECQNKQEVENKYLEILADYDVSVADMNPLDVVGDLLYDYRPYIKAIKNYQGIKPEFLTRLTSNIFNMGNSYSGVIDAFGGSGASTLNYLGRNNIQLKYNDFGWLNVAFYQVIKDEDKRNKLCVMIEDYCKDILAGKDITIRNIKCDDAIFKKTADEIYDDYIKTVGSEAEDKLARIENKYKQRLQSVSEPDVIGNEDFRKIEKSLYALVSRVQKIFIIANDNVEKTAKQLLNGIDEFSAAFIFLMYQNFSDRHFFNDCTIQLFGEFYATYKQTLKIVGEYLAYRKIEIKCGDALELMQDSKYNLDDVNWYLDIPYSETDTSTYSGCIDENTFMECLDGLRGNYAVSSRFNMCILYALQSRKPASYVDAITLAESDENFRKRKNAIYEFYTRFTTEAVSKVFDKNIFNKDTERHYLSSEKQAKYIFIPFVQAQEVYIQSENDIPKKFEGNLLTSDGLKRMLASTLYSNIAIEIIITDVDASKCKTVYWQDDNMGIGVMPTFKMGVNNYNNDASVFIMRYDLFMDELRELLYNKEYIDETIKNIAAAFREIYKL